MRRSGQRCVNEKCSVGVHGCLVVAGLPEKTAQKLVTCKFKVACGFRDCWKLIGIGTCSGSSRNGVQKQELLPAAVFFFVWSSVSKLVI